MAESSNCQVDDFLECSENMEGNGDGGSSSDESDGELV